MQAATLARLRTLKAEKRPLVLVTDVSDGSQELLVFGDGEEPVSEYGSLVVEQAREALRTDRSRMFEVEGGRLFVQAFNPPLRMAIVGAVHISQALAPMADLMGYEVTVIDPRRAFAGEGRFPGINVDTEWPDDALEAFGPDRRSAVVTLTHDPKLDDPALHIALRSPAFYVGSLGSKRTHAARAERLAAAGFSAEQIERIRGPIGLNIGARSPAEIAAAIVAEVTAELRSGARE